MTKTQTAIIATALILLSAFVISTVDNNQTNLQKDPPKTVSYVEIQKYLGVWYEQAVIPFYFERNCERTTANYSLNTDGTIRVDNVCYRNGVKHESIGKAFPDPHDAQHTNAKLKVEFSTTLDIEANYWIVRLDSGYSYSVVSSPNYNYLWILYRSPRMPEDLYQKIYNDLKNDGFPVEKLRRTVQW